MDFKIDSKSEQDLRFASQQTKISLDNNGRPQLVSIEQIEKCDKLFNFSILAKYIPILSWLPNYKSEYLVGDIMAGLVVAVLNISISLSAAIVAETELDVAFRASIVNTIVYALLASSRHVSFGGWSVMSQMLLISVQSALNDEIILDRLKLGSSLSVNEYKKWHVEIMIMFTFLIGLIQMVSGFLKLGNVLSSFIPEVLCSSLIAASSITMAASQLANMFGTSNKKLWSIESNSSSEFLTTGYDLDDTPVDITDIFAGLFVWVKQVILVCKHYDQINVTCAIISSVSVFLLFFNTFVTQKQLERWLKKKILIPFEMILLIILVIISYKLDLKNNYHVPTSGPIELNLIAPSLPDLRLIRELWDRSLATALISYTLVYVMAKTYSNKFNYEVDYNQELIACGAGNLMGGLFDALPATSALARTAAQVESGAQTQLASLIGASVLIIAIKLFGHHVAVLPNCLMSACLTFGFLKMTAKVKDAFTYWRVCKVDFSIWVVTFVSILTVDLVNGFIYGFIYSILTMIYRAQNRRCYMIGVIGNSDVYVPLIKYPEAREIEGIKIFQFCGPIHYVCADLFERLLRQRTGVDVKQVLEALEKRERSRDDSSNVEDSPGSEKNSTTGSIRTQQFRDPRIKSLPTHIILDFSMISYIDSAGICVMKKIIEDYERINVTIIVASLASHVAAMVKHEPSLWEIHKHKFHLSLVEAVHCAIRENHLRRQLGDTISICSKQIGPSSTKF